MNISKLIEPGKWYEEFDESGNCISSVFDESYRRLLGYETEEVYANTHESWSESIHPEDEERLNRYWADFLSKHPEGMDMDIEYRMMTKRGYHWFHDYAYADRRDDGSIIRAHGVVFDIQGIVDKDDEHRKQLAESLTFTNFFLDTYVSAYYVNLLDYECQIYKRTEALEKDYPVIDNYLEGIGAYIERDVHPDDRAELTRILAPEYLQEQLKTLSSFSHYFRDMSNGTEKTYKVQIIRGADKDHAAFGFLDLTEEFHKQEQRLLGAVPLSPDVLTKANIGLWSFELDEGCAPRMYADEAMLALIGLDHQIAPEDTYHAWYDNIDDGSYDLVNDAVEKMVSGEHAEVQYPWHNPNGETWIVRCGGVRNFEYTKGVRIEGTHQNVTQMIHFDEKERKRAKQLETDLAIEKLRTEELAYVTENEPDLPKALDFFGKRILETFGCDQVVFRGVDGQRIVINAPGIEDVPQELCSLCPIADFDNEIYKDNDILIMNNAEEGYLDTDIHPNCSIKSSYMQRIYSNGELAGLFSVHYLKELHTFTDNGIRSLQTVGMYIGLMIGRVKEKQAEIAKIEAESSNKAKTEFLFNMSHDIRTPMNAILGYTDIAIKHGDDRSKVDESLGKIKLAGGHLLNLINDILEMSRIESGKLEISEAPMDIRKVIEGVEQMSSSLAIEKSIDFQTEIGDIKNPYVFNDELHANEVLINLISNAVKYTPEGGKVQFRASQTGEASEGIATYRFEVADNGIGMSEEFQEHLFEAFSREKTSTVSKQQGAGLGLSIVKKIIDLAGGTISVTSRTGKGSTFTVDIPMRIMDEESIEKYKAENTPVDLTKGVFSFENKKVLLVEDNEMNREIATEILEEVGLVVDTAEDGMFAVKAVSKMGVGYYDFVLMDIQMPVMNGYEATKAIRALPDGNKVTIIALSANAFEEDVKKSLEAGMNAHAAKPIDVKALFETMQGLA